MTEKLQQVGRLAFRTEGENWVAYFAKQGTMDGALFLGAIKMMLIEQRPDRKQQFQYLMRDCFADTCEELFGVRPAWRDPIAAPEHERSKKA
jgi:hypothetical protein